MSHSHVGGKKAILSRLRRNQHKAEVLRRKERIAQARLREATQQHDKALKAISSMGLIHLNGKEPLRALAQRGLQAIQKVPEKQLRYHMQHAFLARMAFLRAHAKAERTKSRISELKARDLTKRPRK